MTTTKRTPETVARQYRATATMADRIAAAYERYGDSKNAEQARAHAERCRTRAATK